MNIKPPRQIHNIIRINLIPHLAHPGRILHPKQLVCACACRRIVRVRQRGENVLLDSHLAKAIDDALRIIDPELVIQGIEPTHI